MNPITLRIAQMNGGRCEAISMIVWLSFALPGVAQDADDRLPAVRCLAFSPDGRFLAAAAGKQLRNGKLVVWDAESLQPRWHYGEPVGFPRLAFSPDGKRLALSRFAPETKVFDVASGEEVCQLNGHSDHARCVAYTPNGQHIITGSYDKTIMIWDAETGKAIATIEGHGDAVYDVAVSPDGAMLASADARSGSAQLWNLGTRTKLRTFDQLGSLVPHVVFSPDGQWLCVSSWGGHLTLFDARSHELWMRIDNIGGVNWSAFSPNGDWLALVNNSPTVYVFRTHTSSTAELRERVADLLGKFDDESYDVREDASRQLAEIGPPAEPQLREALRSTSAELRIRARTLRRRLSDPRSAMQLNGHDDAVECVTFSSDGRLMASGDRRGTVTVWSVDEWTRHATISVMNAGE